MRKTLSDVAKYLKEILVPESREPYAIDEVYTNLFSEQQIRDGVIAFRAFLARLYDIVAEKGAMYDTCKKTAHGYENRTTLSVYYPFLYHIGIMLLRIGYFSVLSEDGNISCGNRIFIDKLSRAKNLECLRFLRDCGLQMEAINFDDKKLNLTEVETIKISYADDPKMFIGMKVLAIAEAEHHSLINQDVFLRCDYRALAHNKPDAGLVLHDMIRPLSPRIQDFILAIDQRYRNQGLRCEAEVKGFHIYVKYNLKSKTLWGINASLNNGYHINAKPLNTGKYADAISGFSPELQELIARGYGCGRKRGSGHCDGGCRGLPILLDESVLDLQDDIFAWFDHEVACLLAR